MREIEREISHDSQGQMHGSLSWPDTQSPTLPPPPTHTSLIHSTCTHSPHIHTPRPLTNSPPHPGLDLQDCQLQPHFHPPTKTAAGVCVMPSWCPLKSLQVTAWTEGGGGDMPPLKPRGKRERTTPWPCPWLPRDHPTLQTLPRLSRVVGGCFPTGLEQEDRPWTGHRGLESQRS